MTVKPRTLRLILAIYIFLPVEWARVVTGNENISNKICANYKTAIAISKKPNAKLNKASIKSKNEITKRYDANSFNKKAYAKDRLVITII